MKKHIHYSILIFILLTAGMGIIHTPESTGAFDWWVRNVSNPMLWTIVGAGSMLGLFRFLDDQLLGKKDCKCKDK